MGQEKQGDVRDQIPGQTEQDQSRGNLVPENRPGSQSRHESDLENVDADEDAEKDEHGDLLCVSS